jgi:integrase
MMPVRLHVKHPFHDLRHCHGTYLLQAGVNAKVVQERMGHHTASFTLSTYGHALPGMQEEATRLVAERLLGNVDRKD